MKQVRKRKTDITSTTFIWDLERWRRWSYVQGSKGDTDIQNRLVDTVGEGDRGMVWKESAEAYTLPSVKEIASGSSAYDAGTRSRCSVTTWRMGTQGCLWPIHASLWPIHANLWREPSQYCKAIILYLKKKKEKLKKKRGQAAFKWWLRPGLRGEGGFWVGSSLPDPLVLQLLTRSTLPPQGVSTGCGLLPTCGRMPRVRFTGEFPRKMSPGTMSGSRTPQPVGGAVTPPGMWVRVAPLDT